MRHGSGLLLCCVACPAPVLGRLSDITNGATWGADYLVLRMHAWSEPPGIAQAWPDMNACAANVAAKLGTPIYRDGEITVFALAGAK